MLEGATQREGLSNGAGIWFHSGPMHRLVSALAMRPMCVLVGGLAACSGAGPYDHAALYIPLADEARAATGARDYDPVMVLRQPEAWRGVPVSVFGVVVARAPGPGGAAYLTLSVRRLEPRNLCEYAADESTCLTTISDRDFGSLHALIALRHDDDIGAHAVGPGSLLRLVGPLAQTSDPIDGGPVMHPAYYRHWPRYFFATRSASATLRQ